MQKSSNGASFLEAFVESKKEKRICEPLSTAATESSKADIDDLISPSSQKTYRFNSKHDSNIEIVLEDTSSRLTSSLWKKIYSEGLSFSHSMSISSLDAAMPFTPLDFDLPISLNKVEGYSTDCSQQSRTWTAASQKYVDVVQPVIQNDASLQDLLTSHKLQHLMGLETQTQKELSQNSLLPQLSVITQSSTANQKENLCKILKTSKKVSLNNIPSQTNVLGGANQAVNKIHFVAEELSTALSNCCEFRNTRLACNSSYSVPKVIANSNSTVPDFNQFMEGEYSGVNVGSMKVKFLETANTLKNQKSDSSERGITSLDFKSNHFYSSRSLKMKQNIKGMQPKFPGNSIQKYPKISDSMSSNSKESSESQFSYKPVKYLDAPLLCNLTQFSNSIKLPLNVECYKTGSIPEKDFKTLDIKKDQILPNIGDKLMSGEPFEEPQGARNNSYVWNYDKDCFSSSSCSKLCRTEDHKTEQSIIDLILSKYTGSNTKYVKTVDEARSNSNDILTFTNSVSTSAKKRSSLKNVMLAHKRSRSITGLTPSEQSHAQKIPRLLNVEKESIDVSKLQVAHKSDQTSSRITDNSRNISPFHSLKQNQSKLTIETFSNEYESYPLEACKNNVQNNFSTAKLSVSSDVKNGQKFIKKVGSNVQCHSDAKTSAQFQSKTTLTEKMVKSNITRMEPSLVSKVFHSYSRNLTPLSEKKNIRQPSLSLESKYSKTIAKHLNFLNFSNYSNSGRNSIHSILRSTLKSSQLKNYPPLPPSALKRLSNPDTVAEILSNKFVKSRFYTRSSLRFPSRP